MAYIEVVQVRATCFLVQTIRCLHWKLTVLEVSSISFISCDPGTRSSNQMQW